jgi:integrase
LFNYGLRKKWIANNPTDGVDRYPVDRARRYIPSVTDIDKVVAAADPDTRDYLRVLQDTLARVGEINNLTWDDIDFDDGTVTLYTRKKSHRGLTPRKVPMTGRIRTILSSRFAGREPDKPWVFWHRFKSRTTGEFKVGPFGRRKRLLQGLCEKAGVRPFSFHALRHAGASILEQSRVPVVTVQQLLGHENLKTTQIYLQTLSGSEREAIAIFEAAVTKSHTNSHTAGLGQLPDPVNGLVN